jgi:hypothetical protein
MLRSHLFRCGGYASVALLAVLSLMATESFAQKGGDMNCRDNWFNDRLASHCEIREQTLSASRGTINVDASQNGGIGVKGSDRNDILVRSRVQAAAQTEAEAQEIAKQVRIGTDAEIQAEGPALAQNRYWSVTYEILVPRRFNLSLRSYNGGISISDVSGQIEFDAHNGGVSLNNLSGTVRGRTVNGGLSIRLAGTRWDGTGLDVETTNGGINLKIPEAYSAHLETGTVNGSLTVAFPVTLQGRIHTKRLSVELGSGGPPLRVVTTNGGVVVKTLQDL